MTCAIHSTIPTTTNAIATPMITYVEVDNPPSGIKSGGSTSLLLSMSASSAFSAATVSLSSVGFS